MDCLFLYVEMIMKKRFLILGALLISACVIATGCAKETKADQAVEPETTVTEWEPIPEPTEAPTPEPTPEEPEEIIPEGCYRSELTNEWIDEALMNQRPIAAMVDNEITALPHYGVNSADIVYELMNSTENDRITRLMVIVKDYENVAQLGSIRSTRPTNFMLAAEYNAILIHDGGPFYNDEYYRKDYVNNLSGGFARFSNGKAREFTEYVTPTEYTNDRGKKYPGLLEQIEEAEYVREYNEYYNGPHFKFGEEEVFLDEESGVIEAKDISLPFKHNESRLVYNETTNTYDYYEYGKPHTDELDNGNITSFKNVILQGCSFNQLDANGYLIYNVIGSGMNGYYLTNGKAIPIYWSKDGETAITHFMRIGETEDITINTGKTYISIIPEDSWEQLIIN